MQAFPTALVVATLLCTLVAGFLFAFAVVVMPGIRRLDDAAFTRAFQVIDGVIQDNRPIFLLVWAGSVVALIAALALGVGELAGGDRFLLIGAAVIYLLGVQMPTGAVNVPLNNRLQAVDVEASDAGELRAARDGFEARWNRSNVLRTWLSCLTAGMLMLLLLGL